MKIREAIAMLAEFGKVCGEDAEVEIDTLAAGGVALTCSPVWLAQWERPGCGEYMIEQEDWGSRPTVPGDA
jgi:hypothetical protein